MKKIYAQKRMFLFMNFFSMLFLALELFGGMSIDNGMFYLLFVSIGLSALSLFFLINKIYYDEKCIRFSFIYRKITVKHEDVKEVFIQHDVITGAQVIINLEKETEESCSSYLEYAKICKKQNINNTIYFVGITKADLDALVKCCDCTVKTIR